MSLTQVLGDVPATRILDFMLGHIEYDCTPKEVAEYADVAPSSVKRDIARLVECGVVVETRKIGVVQLYILNNDSVVTEALINLDRVISGDVSEKIADTGVRRVSETRDAGGSVVSADFEVTLLGSEVDAEDTTKYPESEEEWES
jgi:DNA-binding transcriptional ArsR family regulator